MILALIDLVKLQKCLRAKLTIQFCFQIIQKIHGNIIALGGQKHCLIQADELWQRHYGELLRPIPAGMPYAGWTSTVLTPLGVKEDVVIPGVGWMSLSGTCGQIRVTHPQTLEIKHRKAMI